MIGFLSLFIPVLSIAAVALSIIGAKAASFLLGLSITFTIVIALLGIFTIRKKAQWMSIVFSGGLWVLLTVFNKFVAWETKSLRGWLTESLKTNTSTGIPRSVLTNSIGQLSFVLPWIVLMAMIGLFVLVVRITGTSVIGVIREWLYAFRESLGEIQWSRPENFISTMQTLKNNRLTELSHAIHTLRQKSPMSESKVSQSVPVQSELMQSKQLPQQLKESLSVEPKQIHKPAKIIQFEKPVWPSVTFAKDKQTKKNVTIPGKDRFLHTLLIGTTGSGKTARIFEPCVYQDMDCIAKGGKACVIVVEPNRTFAENVAKRAKMMNIPYVFINEADENPTEFLNPFEGKINDVSETITTVLKSLFGQQDGYFQSVQEAASRGITQMLKLLLGDKMTMREFASCLRSKDNLLLNMKELTQVLLVAKEGKLLPWWTEDDIETAENVLESLEGKTGCTFRGSEPVLNPKELEQFFKVANGLQQQIDKIIGNATIRKILTNKSTFKINEWLERPGMIIVNTGNHAAGNTLGRFFLLLLQDALLKRPGEESTRSGVYVYIDEFKEYAASTFSAAFTQARKYRAAFTIAIQNYGQLELKDDKKYAEVVSGNCRNKIILPGLDYKDALAAELLVGKEEVEDKSVAHNEGLFGRKSFEEKVTIRKKEQAIINATTIMYMPKNQCVYKIVINDQQQVAAIGITGFADQKIRYKLPVAVGRVESASVVEDAPDVREQGNVRDLEDSADTLVYPRLAKPEVVQTFTKGSINDRLSLIADHVVQQVETDEQVQNGEKRDYSVFDMQSGQLTFITDKDGGMEIGESVEDKNKARRRRK